MTKLMTIVFFTFLSISSGQVLAAEADKSDIVRPAQIQKNQVPDATANGDYLEPQPDENGALTNTKDKQNSTQNAKDMKSHDMNSNDMKSKSLGSKASNIEKGKRLTETPENGGTTVNPQGVEPRGCK